MQANAFLRSTHWNHVAVSYRAGNAVRLNANQHTIVNCGSDKSFNLQDSFSLEAWIQADQAAQPIPQTIAGKWGQDTSEQSYWLGLNASGQLNLQAQFQYTDQSNEKQLQLMNAVATAPNLRDGQPHHVAAALRSEAKIVTSNNSTSQFVEVTISFFVDGVAAGTSTAKILNVTTANVQGTTTALTMGASGPGPANAASHVAPEAHMYFTGMLTGVVLWSRAIDSKDVANSIQQRAAMQRDGAIVAWWFNEQAGVEAVDTVAGLIAKLSSNDLWAVYNRLSEVSFYSNGRQLLSTDPLSDATMSEGYPSGTVQFTVGGYQNGTTLEDTTAAQFNEIRLWQQTRTPRQISDMRFTRLVGDETGLTGYWNFDDQSLADESAFGNNGVMWNQAVAPFVLSGAPVSNEGPLVLNVYGGQVTEFQQRLKGTPAVSEFSEITREPASALAKPPQDGEAPKLQGSLERAYFYTTGTVNLTPGYYAGALRLVYLGQVQTDATLIGYIEGAPPVPSENLTRPYYGSATGYFSYFNSSSISFTDVEMTTLTFNSSYNYSSTLDHTTSGGFAYGSDVKTTTPVIPLAPEVITTNTKIEFKIGAKEKGSFATQDLAVQNSTSSWALALTDSLALRGNWEKDGDLVNPQVGRRFLPDNVGYALVSSLTADVYLTYNATTGAAVGRSIVPNPDIPPDSNILTFQIDPTYVKNGTLDGKVGLYDDPAYSPGAIPGSYFKPLESYRLKKKIAKQAADEMRYFDQFDTYKRALGSTKSLDDQEPNRLVQRTADGAIARKGLANTYVWTAAGGMHTEQEQFTDQFTTTFTGGYSASNQFGVVTDFKGVGGAAGILVGGFFSLDWMAGFKIDITSTKTRTVADAFGLNVAVTGEPALLGWDGKNYSDQPIPGKVAGYRFNTFYLPPDTDNGSFLIDKVVDRTWLHSNAPDAITLRAAQVGNPAWRILHRVTYVNRIPPSLDNTPNQTLPAPIAHIIDLDNNEVLVDLIVQALGANAPSPANIGAALAIVINPPAQAGQFPPSKLGAMVPWWDAFLATTRSTNRNQANYELLQSLQLDILRYFLAGLNDGSIV